MRVSPLATAVSVMEGESVVARMTTVPMMRVAAARDERSAPISIFLRKLPRFHAGGETLRRVHAPAAPRAALKILAFAGAKRSA
ncbi:hypothetical protein DSM21852_41920 [Methylocystis bryophila]|nr:hypothetical protein DSM21852_41920 [Methylocystis bryophila]